MSGHVFLSYSTRDRELVDRVTELLEREGCPTWTAHRDIKPGETWAGSIVDALSGSRMMVLLLTKHSNVSRQVLRELEIAGERRIPILPVLIDRVQLSKGVRYYVGTYQWLDLTETRESDLPGAVSSAIMDALAGRTFVIGGRRPSWLAPAVAVLLALGAGLLALLLEGDGDGAAGADAAPVRPGREPTALVLGGAGSWDYCSSVLDRGDGGVFAAGTFDYGFWSEMWVVGLDSLLREEWSLVDSVAGEDRPSLLRLPGGDLLVVCGQYADFDHTRFTMSLWRLSPEGDLLWERDHVIPHRHAIQPVTRTVSRCGEDVMVCVLVRLLHHSEDGRGVLMQFDGDGGMSSSATLHCEELRAWIPSDGSTRLMVYSPPNVGEYVVARTDSAGRELASMELYDSGSPPTALVPLEEGGCLVAGTWEMYGEGCGDLFVAELSGSLEMLRDTVLGGPGYDACSDLVRLGDGYAAAGARVSEDGSRTGWLLRFAEDLSLEWETELDLGGSTWLSAVAEQEDGSILAGGYTTARGDPDALLLRLTPRGEAPEGARTGWTLLAEGWDAGLDSAVWAREDNLYFDPLPIERDGDLSLDVNGVPVYTRETWSLEPGMLLCAEVRAEPIGSGDADWLSMGLTDRDPSNLAFDPVESSLAELRWDYSGPVGLRTLTASLTPEGDTSVVLTAPDTSFMRGHGAHLFEIEMTDSLVHFMVDSSTMLTASLDPALHGREVRVFLRGYSGSTAHFIDDLRLARLR